MSLNIIYSLDLGMPLATAVKLENVTQNGKRVFYLYNPHNHLVTDRNCNNTFPNSVNQYYYLYIYIC